MVLDAETRMSLQKTALDQCSEEAARLAAFTRGAG